MGFKLGSETRDGTTRKNVSFAKKSSSSNRKVFRKNSDMGPGVMGQANNDGTIDVHPDIDLNSAFGKKLIKHELKHAEQMDSGKANYGDNWVMWEGKIYARKEENCQPIIDGPNGKWPEGHPNHPWEAEAIQAETE